MRPETRGLITLGAGIVTALNTGKLPPALGALRVEFGLSLVEVSWLVSLLMLASTALGMAGGSFADRFGHRRVMITGLLVTACASAAGALAQGATLLFVSRAFESLGFLLTVLPAPALLQSTAPPARLRIWMSAWGAYLPTGMGLALAVSPWLIEAVGWRTVWALCSGGAVVFAWFIARAHPPAVAMPAASGGRVSLDLLALARMTLCAPGPWLITVCFLFYAAQFISVFAFLPTVYREGGIDARVAGGLTAAAVLVNALGNLSAGWLMQRGVARWQLVSTASVVMAFCAYLSFAAGVPFAWRFGAALTLSLVGGWIPASLFASAPIYAPDPRAAATTVGLMQQGSGIGQLVAPPLVAAVAQSHGDWTLTWTVTGACAVMAALIGIGMGRFDARQADRALRQP